MKSREHLRDVPNIGQATEKLLLNLGINKPADLCKLTHKSYDPCVIDVFISAVRYMEGGPTRKWWEFTHERKKHLSSI